MFGFLFKNKQLRQQGMTLVELLVALAVTGILVTGISVSISQVFSVNAASKARMLAVKEIEVAIDSIRPDILSGHQILTSDPDPNVFLVSKWTEWDAPVAYDVKYYWDPTTNQLSRLPSEGTLNVFAKDIASRPVVTRLDNGNWSITIEATIQGYKSATETRTFEVKPRSGL
jgi:prepilin-type N-terminal cleavage/methylation domain-containing protein